MDSKFKFREHITYVAEKCTKLIYSLSKSAKITWGLRHEVLKMIYEGVNLPLAVRSSSLDRRNEIYMQQKKIH